MCERWCRKWLGRRKPFEALPSLSSARSAGTTAVPEGAVTTGRHPSPPPPPPKKRRTFQRN